MVKTEIRLIIFFAAQDGETMQSAKTRPGADCGSDYELSAKFRLKLKKAGKLGPKFHLVLLIPSWAGCLSARAWLLAPDTPRSVPSLPPPDAPPRTEAERTQHPGSQPGTSSCRKGAETLGEPEDHTLPPPSLGSEPPLASTTHPLV